MTKDLKGIESAFCSAWASWDEHDVGVLGFDQPALHPDVRARISFPQVNYMVVDTQKSVVEFYDGEDFVSFKLDVKLGEAII